MSEITKIIDHISSSPTSYQTVETAAKALTEAGYTQLFEQDSQAFSAEGKYFTVKNGRSLVAFRNGKSKQSFMICSTHGDSPCFKVKELAADKCGCLSLTVEKYGGMICYSWLDRPLSLAGRVVLRTADGIEWRNLNIDKDLLTIPSLAIHMRRDVNDGAKFSPAKDMLPIMGLADGTSSLNEVIAAELGVEADRIISHDLYLYNREGGKLIGKNSELLLSPRLDDLGCVFSSLEAFLTASDCEGSVPVFAVFDNEEVGSATGQGADSDFFAATLSKIAGDSATLQQMLATSFMVSADNAHAKHPNFPELADSVSPILGKGVVIKHNANQRYATDAVSDAIFVTLCERCGMKPQYFYTRPDLPCGSTLGSISTTHVPVPTVDIGLPQLAMHSSTELVALSDLADMCRVLRRFYSSRITVQANGMTVTP